MISPSKVEEVERLLATGSLSQRQIAKQAGISRATVSGIAAGTRPDYAARQRERERVVDEPRGPLVRCGGCGGRVYSPCHLCKVRQVKAAEKAQLAPARCASPQRHGLPIGRPPAPLFGTPRDSGLGPAPRLAG
jgi:hypothetical protein